MPSNNSALFLLASVAIEETKTTYTRKIHQWKFWKNNEEKKFKLTHFLGQYLLLRCLYQTITFGDTALQAQLQNYSYKESPPKQ